MKNIFKFLCLISLMSLLTQCQIPKSQQSETDEMVTIMSFNILQGGHNAANVGFPNSMFNGSRYDDLANIILNINPDIVGIQEDTSTDSLLYALGDEWYRCKNIYSKYKMKFLESSHSMVNACRVYLPHNDSLVFINTHWWPVGGLGYVEKTIISNKKKPEDMKAFEKEVIEATLPTENGPRGYNATLNMVKKYLTAGEKVIVVGDFNEPSHLDWTERYVREGKDKWIKNRSSIPFKFAIEWPGSKKMAEIGLMDAYRVANPDEVNKPGFTWTPPYANGTPGRKDYDDQTLERLDRIYFNAGLLKCTSSSVITNAEGDGEIKIDCIWPSDHWALCAEFSVK